MADMKAPKVNKKADGRFFIQYRIPGQTAPVKEYFGRGPEAERAAIIRAAEISLDAARGVIAPRSTACFLDELAQAYLIDAAARGTTPGYRKELTNLLNDHLLPALTHKPVDQLEHSDILSVQEIWAQRSPATRNRYMGYLRAIFLFGVQHEMTTKNPMARWRKAKEPDKRGFHLCVDDLRRLIAKADPHVAWALEVAWMTGARPGPTELFKMRHDDHDPAGLTLHIRGTKTPRADRFIPITSDESSRLLTMASVSATGHLIEYKGQPVKQMYKGIKTAVKRAGLNYEVCWYDVRHLWISEMLRKGADLAAVSSLAGHADITTTQRRYYHVLQGERRRAVDLKPEVTNKTTAKVVRIR